MNPKYQRLRFILISMGLMALGATLILRNFQDNLVFFFTPSQWQEKQSTLDASQTVRIGGLVKVNSVNHSGNRITFFITDMMADMPVTYEGLLPTLFREGQGVVAEGIVDKSGAMTATTILAKHDENYMPREVVEQLKASGQWKEYGTAP